MPRTPGAKDIRGRERLSLVLDLAANDMPAQTLADKYGRHVQTIHTFMKRNRAEIEEARREMAGELSGLWVNRKAQRIAEYQQAYEDIEQLLDDDTLTPADISRYIVTQLRILSRVADEMGHLPSRVPGEGPAAVMLRHEVLGVDLATALFGRARHTG
jgi:IS30 family transposase